MTNSNGSLPAASEGGLVRVPLSQLHPHPANPNLMDEQRLDTLVRNI